jgi:hypothetical protein
MASSWFYMRDNKRVGPVAIDQLRQLAATGALAREDSVWTVGMNQWTPAGDVPGVFHAATAAPVHAAHSAAHAPAMASAPAMTPATIHATAPAFAPPPMATPATVSYYDGGLPPRAATTLRGHAPPTGDTGDWPLDDVRVAQFADAFKIRKKVTGAAQLYRALLLLSTIALVIIFVAAVIGALTGGGGGRGGSWEYAVMFGMAGFLGAFCALYYFTWRATMRSHRWAPLTMFILFALGVAMNLFSIVMATSGRPEEMIGGIIGMILPAIFAVVSWTSFAAIPRWRAQPAWCQELIVKSGH